MKPWLDPRIDRPFDMTLASYDTQSGTSSVVARETAVTVRNRVLWVDYGKGWCIVLVVMMHATLGVGLSIGETGWLHEIVAFAKPFRMPDFFVISGLFLGRIIDQPWRVFADKRVVHFVYFYALWFLVSLVLKSGQLGLHDPGAFV
ncbi:MAG TPA: acyltransferase family protein, partial [Beijerinckiaceae bacterium]|nr:acyltransferase family protein [Beijerinckiaceae bacterium]